MPQCESNLLLHHRTRGDNICHRKKKYQAPNATAAHNIKMNRPASAIIHPLEAGSGSKAEDVWDARKGFG
jgi:hypothetical protein